MKHQTLVRIKRFNSDCSRASWRNYAKLFEHCCLVHQNDAPFFGDALSLLKGGDVVGLVRLADSLSSTAYLDARMHFLANQLSLLIRKYPFPKCDKLFAPREKAITTLLASEHRCKRTNKKFRVMRSVLGRVRFSRDYAHRLATMRSWITYVLGSAPSLEAVYDSCDFGPGASIGVSGNATNIARKLLSEKWSVTPEAFQHAAIAMFRHSQVRQMVLAEQGPIHCLDFGLFVQTLRSRVDVLHNNKITFVPKTVKTERSIAVEPLLNGFLQKGVDLEMRKRLKRVNVDLTDQSFNQRLAHLGSAMDGSFCTIDLSSASDSLAVEVVRELIPPEWFSLLDALRSKEGFLDGRKIAYEKFCSMGNGFCFPLESLIFAACVTEAGGKLGVDAAVYGDDIIVQHQIFDRVVSNLSLLGFKLNTDKTFSSGPFRESCGADYFGGEDVRPFTLDFKLDSLSSLIKLHNLTRRNAYTTAFFRFLGDNFFEVPSSIWYLRPYPGPADTAVEVEWDVFQSSPHARFCRATWSWSWNELLSEPVCDRTVSSEERYPIALLYGALRGASSDKPFTVRRKTRTKVVRKYGSGATSNWVPAPQSATSQGCDWPRG